MTTFISKQQMEKMKKTIVDFSTDMTEWDLYENQHCYDDIIVL